MKRMKYLVTGAAGNLGSSIARQLVSEGKQVRALVLKGDPAAERLPGEVELVVGDVTDIGSLKRFFADSGDDELIVIHCASVVTVSPDFNKKAFDVNVGGTRNIVDECVAHAVKKLVYISSTSAIPEIPKNQPIAEVDRFDASEVVGFYGKTKAEATRIVLDAVRERGLDASVVFPSGICGPGDYAFGPVASFIIDYVGGRMKAGVAGSFNAVDVRDLADGVIACCERGRAGEGYIMANECVSMAYMFRIIVAETGSKSVRTILPIPVAYAIAFFLGITSKLTGIRPRLTTFAVYNLARNNYFCCAKAMAELGYKVRPFEETIADTLAWLKAEGKA